MGLTPREKDLTITFDCQFKVKVPDVTLTTLLKAFTYLLPKILVDFIQKALIGYGELVMARKQKPFACPKCGNAERFTWKTRAGKPMEVLTT